MAVEIVEALPGMAIGKGFDTVTEDVKSTPAVAGKIGMEASATGQTGASSLVMVKGSEEFDQALGIEASASFGWGPFSASAKAKFKKSCKVSKQATFCVLTWSALNPLQFYTGDIQLTSDAEELLRLGKMERFRERFGDRFIAGLQTGGEFFGSLRIESESEEKQTEIATKISASYAMFRAEGKVDSSTSEIVSKEKIEILSRQAGGDILPVYSLVELFERAKKVAQQVASGHAFPVSVTLEDYDELDLPGDNISFVQQQHAREVMRKLGQHYKALMELQNDIDFVLRHQDFYVKPDVKKLNAANQRLTDDLNAIVEHADRCARDLSKCEHFTPTIPAIDLPSRKVKSKPAKRPLPGPASLHVARLRAMMELLQRQLPGAIGKEKLLLMRRIAMLQHQVNALTGGTKTPRRVA